LIQAILDQPDSFYPKVRPIVSCLHQAVAISNGLSDFNTLKPRDNRPADAIVVGDLIYKFVPKSDNKLAPRLIDKDKPYLVLDRNKTTITYEDHMERRANGHVSNLRLARQLTLPVCSTLPLVGKNLGLEQAELHPKRFFPEQFSLVKLATTLSRLQNLPTTRMYLLLSLQLTIPTRHQERLKLICRGTSCLDGQYR
jgi:hypothetical protein